MRTSDLQYNNTQQEANIMITAVINKKQLLSPGYDFGFNNIRVHKHTP